MTNIVRCPIWRAWILDRRKHFELTKRELAEMVGINASYVTLFERDGYVPSRAIVQAIGELFGCPDVALANAGYVPDSIREPFIGLMLHLSKA